MTTSSSWGLIKRKHSRPPCQWRETPERVDATLLSSPANLTTSKFSDICTLCIFEFAGLSFESFEHINGGFDVADAVIACFAFDGQGAFEIDLFKGSQEFRCADLSFSPGYFGAPGAGGLGSCGVFYVDVFYPACKGLDGLDGVAFIVENHISRVEIYCQGRVVEFFEKGFQLVCGFLSCFHKQYNALFCGFVGEDFYSIEEFFCHCGIFKVEEAEVGCEKFDIKPDGEIDGIEDSLLVFVPAVVGDDAACGFD